MQQTLRRDSLTRERLQTSALIILSAPEDARDARAEEEVRTSRVRHLTSLIRRRPSSTRKSRTGSVTYRKCDVTGDAAGTWSRRVGPEDDTIGGKGQRTIARTRFHATYKSEKRIRAGTRGPRVPEDQGCARPKSKVYEVNRKARMAFMSRPRFSLFSYASSRKCVSLRKM